MNCVRQYVDTFLVSSSLGFDVPPMSRLMSTDLQTHPDFAAHLGCSCCAVG